ncbi:hypothetical protein UY3_01002 [Chelonia mydas]|uniref:Uncharacterized protein n=1 Tax=Chelonia mydas TaxID=8469 RepID=M7CAN8_CHEMY|nr:hypothetical protein UY3_01002 [Chelonia mydas]
MDEFIVEDISLLRVTWEAREGLLQQCGFHPGPYATLVPAPLTTQWRRYVTLTGTRSTVALLRNLHKRIAQLPYETFDEITVADYCDVREHINALFRIQACTQPQAFFLQPSSPQQPAPNNSLLKIKATYWVPLLLFVLPQAPSAVTGYLRPGLKTAPGCMHLGMLGHPLALGPPPPQHPCSRFTPPGSLHSGLARLLKCPW